VYSQDSIEDFMSSAKVADDKDFPHSIRKPVSKAPRSLEMVASPMGSVVGSSGDSLGSS
jgi:hypothetical protein